MNNERNKAVGALYEISQLLNTGLDPETINIIIDLCDQGVNPESLALVIKNLTEESKSNTTSSH